MECSVCVGHESFSKECYVKNNKLIFLSDILSPTTGNFTVRIRIIKIKNQTNNRKKKQKTKQRSYNKTNGQNIHIFSTPISMNLSTAMSILRFNGFFGIAAA